MKTVTNQYYIMDALDYSPQYYHIPLALFDPDNNQLCIIGAGTSDNVELFSEPGFVYIYTGNDRLGYMGLDVYDINSGESVGDIFIDHDVDYAQYERFTPMNRTKAMLNHL